MENHVPSFSSSLLDAIYRSIDLPHPPPTPITFSYPDSMKVKCADTETYRHMCALDNWSAQGITSERYLVLRNQSTNRSFVPGNSSVISSDSSGFSPSESVFTVSRSSSSCYSTKRSEFRTFLQARSSKKPCVSVKIPLRDGASTMKPRPKGKSYGDSKKVMRQPISPGGKLASFLNSIFNTKKARIVVQSLPEPSNHSACSTSSSFSRSCLSVKTTPSTSSSSSRRKSTEKRSVRFCPVNFILDEDCRPCGHKISPIEGAKPRNVLGGQVAAVSEPDFNIVMEDNRRVVEAAREMLRNYQNRKGSNGNDSEDGDVGDDGEDVASCASSDLFELDKFDCYREELPVYGTTIVGANRAIANGSWCNLFLIQGNNVIHGVLGGGAKYGNSS